MTSFLVVLVALCFPPSSQAQIPAVPTFKIAPGFYNDGPVSVKIAPTVAEDILRVTIHRPVKSLIKDSIYDQILPWLGRDARNTPESEVVEFYFSEMFSAAFFPEEGVDRLWEDGRRALKGLPAPKRGEPPERTPPDYHRREIFLSYATLHSRHVPWASTIDRMDFNSAWLRSGRIKTARRFETISFTGGGTFKPQKLGLVMTVDPATRELKRLSYRDEVYVLTGANGRPRFPMLKTGVSVECKRLLMIPPAVKKRGTYPYL